MKSCHELIGSLRPIRVRVHPHVIVSVCELKKCRRFVVALGNTKAQRRACQVSVERRIRTLPVGLPFFRVHLHADKDARGCEVVPNIPIMGSGTVYAGSRFTPTLFTFFVNQKSCNLLVDLIVMIPTGISRRTSAGTRRCALFRSFLLRPVHILQADFLSGTTISIKHELVLFARVSALFA